MTWLDVSQLTNAREPERLETEPISGKRVTAEACAHHLYLGDAADERRGSPIKCSPAIKRAEDRAALRRGELFATGVALRHAA